jgi:hypothetical protein
VGNGIDTAACRCCSGACEGRQWQNVHWAFMTMSGATAPEDTWSRLRLGTPRQLERAWELPPAMFVRPDRLCDAALDEENRQWMALPNHPCNFLNVTELE